MQYDIEMESLAAQLGAGQHTGIICPACGDKSPDRAMSMLVDGTSIKAICHRASCGFKYSNVHHDIHVERPSRVRPYMGALHTLDAADFEWLSKRFRAKISAFGAMRKSEDRYFLPINGPEGTRRGWVSRRPWEGSPLYDGRPVQSECKSPKSLTYMDNEEPVQDWYTFGGVPVDRRGQVILVEDQISALRALVDTGTVSIALLGTGVNEEKVAEIQRHTKSILIALDSDATGQAFSIARKWGQAFDSCRVIILDKDIKDMHPSQVRKLF